MKKPRFDGSTKKRKVYQRKVYSRKVYSRKVYQRKVYQKENGTSLMRGPIGVLPCFYPDNTHF